VVVADRIKASELDESVIQLDFARVRLLLCVALLAGRAGLLSRQLHRMALLAVSTNATALSLDDGCRRLVRQLSGHLHSYAKQRSEMLGQNRAACELFSQYVAARRETQAYAEAFDALQRRTRRRRNKEGQRKRAILTLT